MSAEAPASDDGWEKPINISTALKVTVWIKQNLTPCSKNIMCSVFKKWIPASNFFFFSEQQFWGPPSNSQTIKQLSLKVAQASQYTEEPKHSRASLLGLL